MNLELTSLTLGRRVDGGGGGGAAATGAIAAGVDGCSRPVLASIYNRITKKKIKSD